ncbi:MAG: beta-lactamase family protein [Clostridiales bacterium]|jgi:CubicO group peptidase (beta-lactamase class C family)|nr:beta-lactamase family protein [Clostridiales bacterium]
MSSGFDGGGFAGRRFAKLSAYLDSLGERYGIPACDLLIYKDHEQVYRHMAGFADLARTRPVSDSDLYFVYSATKIATCVAALQLVERGLMPLSDPLCKYLPAFGDMRVDASFDWGDIAGSLRNRRPKTRPATGPILVRHLLAMTAGLTYNYLSDEIQDAVAGAGGGDGNGVERGASTARIAEAIARVPLAYEPGTRWMYSLAHDVLAAAIEAASGMKFSDYLAKNIWAPLGIESASFDPGGAAHGRLSQQYRAVPAVPRGDEAALGGEAKDAESRGSGPRGGLETPGVNIVPIPAKNHLVLSPCHESGGAGLICTAGDYALFADALCNRGIGRTGRRILGEKMTDEMRMDGLNGIQAKDFAMFNRKGYSYGLGVRTLVDAAFSKSPIGEFGWDGAAGAYALMDADNRLCIFYAQHVLDYGKVYSEIHPAIRDLAYEALWA